MILPYADAVLRFVRSVQSGKIPPEFAGISPDSRSSPESGRTAKSYCIEGIAEGEKTANPAGAGFGKKQGGVRASCSAS